MSAHCRKCSTQNPPNSRYCKTCGNTLGATMANGHTVVAPPSQFPVQVQDQHLGMPARPPSGCGIIPPASLRGSEPNQRASQREHVVFVIDKSGSMAELYDGGMTKMEAAKRANITMLIEKWRIDPDDEAGVVAFDGHGQTLTGLLPLRSQKRQVIEAIQSLTPSNGTDINDALKTADGTFDWNRSDVVRRIVLLTDGHGGHPIRTADDLKKRGLIIDVIGVGPDPTAVDEKLLRKVASVIEGEIRYRFIKDQQTLVAHYTQLAGKTSTS